MGYRNHCPHCQARQRQAAELACVQAAAARRAALADTPTRVCTPGQCVGTCPTCQEVVTLLRRQNRLLEELLEAMGVRP